jgi:type II secretory pathway pseudopilin PulG
MHSGGSRGRARAGWTLLEIVISMVNLLTLLVGFSYGLVTSTSLGTATREQGAAREAARGQLELLRGTAFEEVLARFDDDPTNDPATGASPGAHFDVPGLDARPDDPDGHVGDVVFPLNDDGELREDLTCRSWACRATSRARVTSTRSTTRSTTASCRCSCASSGAERRGTPASRWSRS